MRKASKILLIIGGVFAILAALYGVGTTIFGFLYAQFGGLVNLSLGGLGAILASGVLNDIIASSGADVPAEVADLIAQLTAMFGTDMTTSIFQIIIGVMILGLSFVVLISGLIAAVVSLVAGILGLVSSGKKAKKGLYIANFVLAGLIIIFFGGSWITYLGELLIITGSILGLIASKKEKALEEQQAVVETEVIE